jgi:serine/threonine protein kinase
MSTPPSTADRNLIFGLLALQMDFVSREQLLDAMNAWMLDKQTPLGDILCRRGVLTEEERTDIDRLVDRHIKRHGDDPKASLAALRAEPGVRHDLHRLGDPDMQASIASLASSPAEHQIPTTVHDALPPTLPASLRYRRLRGHAKGGLGEVFVALDEELNREVALKEMQERFADEPESRARFLREARITAKLDHPGVAPVYGLGAYPDGRPFYAMRFLKGRTLSQAVRDYHFNREDGKATQNDLALLTQALIAVCNTVAYAHSRGVVHRDLKGSNVLLGDFGEVIVLDWGLARQVGAPREVSDAQPLMDQGEYSDLTLPGQALGTPSYMAPEQAAGRLDEIGPATDIYGLGAMLYEILTGRPPFTGSDTYEVLRKVREEEPLPPSVVSKQVPPALEAACLRALQKDPTARQASATQFSSELFDWMSRRPRGDKSLEELINNQQGERRLKVLVGALATGCRIVGQGHAQGTAYQTITADSFFVDEEGRFVTFFTHPVLAQANVVVLTPDTARRGERITPRTDVYLLGIILYKILTGTVPFAGLDGVERLRRMCEEGPLPPHEVQAEVPPALEAICLKAMATRPEDRYPSAAEFAQDLTAWLQRRAVSVWRDPWPVQLWRWFDRPLTWSGVGLRLILGVAGAVLVLTGCCGLAGASAKLLLSVWAWMVVGCSLAIVIACLFASFLGRVYRR